MTNEIAGRTARAGFGKSTSMKARAGSANGGYEVGRLMRTEVHRVGLDVSANDAAQLMWEKDIGVVPVHGSPSSHAGSSSGSSWRCSWCRRSVA